MFQWYSAALSETEGRLKNADISCSGMCCSQGWVRDSIGMPKLLLITDSKGISKLPQIQLILPYEISCIRVSLEIPSIFLVWV